MEKGSGRKARGERKELSLSQSGVESMLHRSRGGDLIEEIKTEACGCTNLMEEIRNKTRSCTDLMEGMGTVCVDPVASDLVVMSARGESV